MGREAGGRGEHREGSRVTLYSTPEHECSYLEGEDARTVFVDPSLRISTGLYGVLARHGFRRSGDHVYRPYCERCSACVPVRVPVERFRPARRHRRTVRRNADLTVDVLPGQLTEEYFALYERYLNQRHRGGSMENPTRESFRNFLLCGWSHTEFAAFRLDGELIAIAVMDPLDDGLSAVYTFFDPAHEMRSPGTNALLWQIEEVRRRGLRYLYLGYWIERSPKMAYKAEFLPQERLLGDTWVGIDG